MFGNIIVIYIINYIIMIDIILVFIFLLSIIILVFLFNIITKKYKFTNYFNNKQNNKIINKQYNKINNIKKDKINNIKKDKINNKIKKQEIIKLFIKINNKLIGFITIKLFDNIVPKTCNNFRILCKKGKYNNCPFHRIIKDFMIQCGDFTKHNGTGGESIYGNTFEDENFDTKHDKPYLLSMANAGPNTNGSQFFITTVPTPHLDGKHVVFGEIIDGFDLIDKLNNIDTNQDDKPLDKIIISNSIIDYK
jgi:cyclophilin family peptidyl-prolyl cis-trans isomerase